MAEEELMREKHVRAAHRTATTKLTTRAGAVIGTVPTDVDELTLLKTSLSDNLTMLEEMNARIVALTPEDQL